MDAEKTMIGLLLIVILSLLLIKMYTVIQTALLGNEYYVLVQEKKELQKENIELNVKYLQEASYGNLYWVARKAGFVQAKYYILK